MKKSVAMFFVFIALILTIVGCGEEASVEKVDNEEQGDTTNNTESLEMEETNWLQEKGNLTAEEEMIRNFVEEFYSTDVSKREEAISTYIHPEVQDLFYMISGFSDDSDKVVIDMDSFVIIETVEYEEDGETQLITLTRHAAEADRFEETVFFFYENKIGWYFSPTVEDKEMRETFYDMRELFSAESPPDDKLVTFNEAASELSEDPLAEETADDKGNDVGTRSAPLTIGERVSLNFFDFLHGQVNMELELLEVISGDEAWEMVRQGNQFNDAPEDHQEYILAKFDVKIHELEEEPFDLYHGQFDAVSTDGNTYDYFISVAGLEPSLSNELYEGAEREGYTYFLVDKDDEDPLVAFQRRSDAEVWFQLRQ